MADSIWRRIAPHRSSSHDTEALALTLLKTPALAVLPIDEVPAPAWVTPVAVPVRAPDAPAVTIGNSAAVFTCTVANATRYAASAATMDWLASSARSTSPSSVLSRYWRHHVLDIDASGFA
ncbi:hypothetical protein D3C85_1157700 [compost metagenome]